MRQFIRALGYFLVGVGASLAFLHWLRRFIIQTGSPQPMVKPSMPAQPTPQKIKVDPVSTKVPVIDDLTLIKGIGPKTATALQALGINSLSALASASEEDLRKQLSTQRGITSVKLSAWIAQAKEMDS